MIDLIQMLGNLSRSLEQVDYLVTGMSYLLGIVFMISGIMMFRKIANAGGRSQDHHFKALAIIAAGTVLLYLPSSIGVLSNTVFGNENILSYSSFQKWDIYDSMGMLLKTVGLIWFIRGCLLMIHASQPGEPHGLRGLLFVITGILAMNFIFAMAALSDALNFLVGMSFHFKR
jgi:hypothetical protein